VAATRPGIAYLAVGGLSWPLVRFLYRTKWQGRNGLPKSGGLVLACNHLSNFDPWPVALGIFPRRYVRFMAKLELFRPPLGAITRALGAFPVDRGNPDRAALQTAVELCRDGHVLVMFPEGTRRAKGLRNRHAARPHTGAARIALRARVPLIPAAVSGTDRLGRLQQLRVIYGLPLDLDDLAGVSRREAADIATDRLMTAIAELERELGMAA
jgi:1-acyl-sn-glycerol-3-phosphate acyltransferase